jgi:hypothetical protein
MAVILEAPFNNMRDAAFNHPLATVSSTYNPLALSAIQLKSNPFDCPIQRQLVLCSLWVCDLQKSLFVQPYRMLPFFQTTLQEINDMFKSDQV